MTITLGVDSLCWHMPLEAGRVSIEDVLRDAASLGAPVVALNLHHTRSLSVDEHRSLASFAGDLGIRLLAQGDFLGSPRRGDVPTVGVDRIRRWLPFATAIGSPTLRLASGFYRAELAARPDLIEAERRYVTDVLLTAREDAAAAGVRLILENHSDFLVTEYEAIVREVGADDVGIFLDLINPIMTFDDVFRAIDVLAPLARSGHVRDFELISVQQPDAYHRRGFDVRYRYPGEGVAPLREVIGALVGRVGDRSYDLLIEGLDSTADALDQHERLAMSMPLVRGLLEEAGGVRAVVFTGAGGNEVVEVMERPDPHLAPHEVLVAVDVAGMNPADLEQREGRYPAPAGAVADVPGLEVAGEVVRTGEAVRAWRPHDRVFGLVAGGGLASRVAVHEGCVTRVPDTLDATQAAAVPEAWITAHDALRQADLRQGETLLVRGATGAVGSAAVQIATLGGAHVLAPVRTEGAAQAIRALGAEPVDDELGALRAAAGEHGVDVVLELVGGEHVAADLAALAVGGRIVVVSVAAGSTVELDLLRLMVRRATLRGTVLRARSIEEKIEVVAAFARDVVPLLADGRARPAIDRVVPVDDIHAAFDRLGSRGKSGKVLVRFA